jgi:hypothetical protein
MVIVMMNKLGLPGWMKASIIFLSIVTAFLFGVMWGEPELVEEAPDIIFA